MIRIGINGNLIDAIFKSRVLQCHPENSIDLLLTPCCRPLVSFFKNIKSVRSIEIDEKAIYRNGHGEQNNWTVPLDLDMAYPGYPSEWLVNYVAAYCSLPKISRQDWFGSLNYIIRQPIEMRSNAVYVEARIAAENDFMVRFSRFPNLDLVLGNNNGDVLLNIIQAASCTWRIVSFDVEMAMMSVLGLECIVDRRNQNPGHYSDLFRSYGETIVDTDELLVELARQRNKPHGVEISKSAKEMIPRLVICIPTLCCGDLLEESVAALRPQLSAADSIWIIDNGKQQLLKRLPSDKIYINESNHNLGVSGSWNRFIKETLFNRSPRSPRFDWILMLNDDICLAERQLDAIKAILKSPPFANKWMVVGPCGWSVFAINRPCIENVGFFDEEFFPAYFEDNDYHYRLRLIDQDRYAQGGAAFCPLIKRNSATVARLPHINRFIENQNYYLRKWGGTPGSEKYTVPFNITSDPDLA